MPSWQIVRLITNKEFRDLMRDRRTVMLIIILPAVLYPLFGATAFLFARTMLDQQSVIGVMGAEQITQQAIPSLLDGDRFVETTTPSETVRFSRPLTARRLAGDPAAALRRREVDAVLIIPPDFSIRPTDQPRSKITILNREGDETSKLATQRVKDIVRQWERRLREARFLKQGLPKDFDQIFDIVDPFSSQPPVKKAADELRDSFTQVFPFLLMLWLVSGAIHPAVDMTAGEKERGTMETLLISPVDRTEIVLGKFLATTLFAFGSVIWNALWIIAAALFTQTILNYPIVNLIGLAGCVVIGLPLAMLFSAVCVALGVFAKSTKEGQYYLLPLILLVLPLAFWSMAPGAQLDGSNCWIPITGALLLQQQLLSLTQDAVPWGYALPIFGSLGIGIVAALSLAIWQFHRESVLFRESRPASGGFLNWFRARPDGKTSV
ncbi:MAG: ABC transporter permease subunit [Bacteroidales bacterium]|nr:ABC transporter permease subunit [Bacteroidales bacterium]